MESARKAHTFLSTPSARRATPPGGVSTVDIFHFYPRPPRGGRPTPLCTVWMSWNFYPRPPRGGRPDPSYISLLYFSFLSTPSARRATPHRRHHRSGTGYFYPRPPRGGRRSVGSAGERCTKFLSTPSARRATHKAPPFIDGWIISIHALREEGDKSESFSRFSIANFYPRPPRGGRHRHKGTRSDSYLISIHALREEGDIEAPHFKNLSKRFLSTPSARRATRR